MPDLPGFVCSKCGDIHSSPLTCIAMSSPTYYMMVPPTVREERCWLTDDRCVIDDKHFYIYGSLELSIRGQSSPFIWGVWVSVNKNDFMRDQELIGFEGRESEPPYTGLLSTDIPLYPPCLDLVCEVHTRPVGYRPVMIRRPADHPLVQEQQQGISIQRRQEILEWCLHGRFEGV